MSAHFTRGLQLYSINRYEEALNSFKEALVEDVYDMETKFHMGLCYLQLNQLDHLKNISETIISENPDASEGFYLLAIYYHTEENFKEAIHHINNAIAINPYNSSFYGYKSISLLSLKKFDEALKSANEGLAINPKDVICLNARTKSLTKLKRNEEAYSTLENTLSDNPEDYFTHANAGWTNLELGNYEKANIHFKEALQKDPNDDYARSGALEAIKAKNFIYRYFLKYAFWMQNKNTQSQWIFIIGFYLAYRLLVKASSEFGLNFLIPVFVILYLTFVLGTWIITPVSNSILLFSSYSKYLLDKQDKRSALSFIIITSLAIVSLISYYIFINYNLLFLSISSFCSLIPISSTLQKSFTPLKNIKFWYGVGILLLGFFNFIYYEEISIFVPIVMFASFTWFQGIIKNN